MNESLFNNSKGEIIHSMMRHPEHSKLIKEAVNSPLGSTSRTKARKMFSIMSKLSSSNYDGSGGPGMMLPQMSPSQDQAPMQVSTENNKGIVIFRKIPSPKIHYGVKPAAPKYQDNSVKSYDGSGGPSNKGYDGEGGWFSDAYDNFTGAISSAYNDPLGTASNLISSLPTNYTNPLSPTNVVKAANYYINPPAPAPVDPGYQPGLIQKATNWVADTALPAAGKAVGAVASTVAGIPQYLVQNTIQGGVDAYRALAGYNVNSQNPGPGYITLGGTLGGQLASSISPASPTAPVVPKTTTQSAQSPFNYNPASTYSTLNGMKYNAAGDPLAGAGTAQTPAGTTNTQTSSSQTKTISNTDLSSYATDPQYTAKVKAYVDKLGGENKLNDASSVATALATFGSYGDKTNEIASGIYTAAVKYGIDPTLLTAQILQETGGKMSNVATANNNLAGITASSTNGLTSGTARPTAEGGNYAKFNTLAESIDAQARIVAGLAAGSPTSVTSSSTGSTPTTGDVKSNIASDITDNLGAGMAAFRQITNKDDPVTHGLTAEQAIAAKDTELRSKWGVDALKEAKYKAEQEQINLPQDMATYIRDRDQYVAQTDKEIDAYRASISNMDMSNPANFQAANQHLNYLYTLRGRQNQSYIGYIQQASELHQKKVDQVTHDYDVALDGYQNEIKSAGAITAGQYQLYMAALTDMYKEVQDAPTRLLQLQYLQKQVLSASTLSPSDVAKTGFIEQGNKLEGYVWDSNHMAIPGKDLVKTIQDLSVLDPTYSQQNVLTAYQMGVENYLNAPDTLGTNTTAKIDASSKQAMAEEAIRNYAHLAMTAESTGNDAYLTYGVNNAYKIANTLASNVQRKVVGSAPQLMEAVKTLAPSGFFSAKVPPTEAQFLATVAKLTAGGVDASIAKAIYATFDRYRQADGNKLTSAADAVNAMLYNTSSTTSRTDKVPLTPDEFSKGVGTFYALNTLESEFAQSPAAASAMNNVLYPK